MLFFQPFAAVLHLISVMTMIKPSMDESERRMDEQTYLARMKAAERMLYRVACAMLTSDSDRRDAMQETALRAWEKRNTLRDERFFQTWCVRIMINVCRSMLRQKRRILLTDKTVEQPSLQGDTELRMILDAMPAHHRLPLVLHYLEGFSVEEIARAMGLPAGTVKYCLHQARKALRVELDGKEG